METVNDISEILKVTKIKPKKIYIYTSPNWKQDIYKKAIELDDKNKLDMGSIMKDIMSDPDMRKKGKIISKFIGKLNKEIIKLSNNDKKRYLTDINEKNYLDDSKDYIKKIFNCDVNIYNSDEKEKYDPENKSRFAEPLKPAIYIE